MRVPRVLRDSINAYLDARAPLLLVKHGTFNASPLESRKIADTIQTIAFPGLGNGVGQMGPKTCARQVRQAIEEVVLS